MSNFKIKNVLISVSSKENLDMLLPFLKRHKTQVFTTNGTFNFLKSLSEEVSLTKISDYTKFPELLDGRVKTLHPLIHAGILANKKKKKHLKDLNQIKCVFFDLIIVNLYEFEQIISQNKPEEMCLENIDIGGSTILRAAAKNYENIIVLSDPNQYKKFIKLSQNKDDRFPINYRKELATEAFKKTAYYDSIISNWFSKRDCSSTQKISTIPLNQIKKLRYGENPHQKATLYSISKQTILQLSGKPLSYNNILDLEVASELVNQFKVSSCVIVKHGNPCGASCAKEQIIAYKNALQTDKESAFGGVVAFNKKLEKNVAIEISKLFTELVIAPEYSKEALSHLRKKKNLVLIQSDEKYSKKLINQQFRSTRNYVLVQNSDNKKLQEKKLRFVTNLKPSKDILNDLLFAQKVAKFMNSNAVVISKNLTTISLSSGQTSRIEAARQSVSRLNRFIELNNSNPKNLSLASDGFFPFTDIIEICSLNNINSIIQPGGSINDSNLIEQANKKKISMVFSNIRNFKH